MVQKVPCFCSEGNIPEHYEPAWHGSATLASCQGSSAVFIIIPFFLSLGEVLLFILQGDIYIRNLFFF